MASVGTTLKREAAVQGYKFWFNSISGSEPNVSRHADGAEITFAPGQAKAIENYFGEMIPYNLFYLNAKKEQDKKEEEGEALNVNVPWGKVFIPLALKTVLPPLAIYTAAVVLLAKKL
jgi:hypothetical protein